eukprot:364274-Chlamydomonas_euryale.AAC.5
MVIANACTPLMCMWPRMPAGLQHVVRFVESFETRPPTGETAGYPAGSRHSGGGDAGSGGSGRAADGADSHTDLWLVFRDEGVSLQDLMYEAQPLGGAGAEQGVDGVDGSDDRHADDADANADGSGSDAGVSGGHGGGGFSVLGPSRWWRALRTGPDARAAPRSIIRQALQALDTLHSLNISHRDIKPANMLLAPGAACGSRGGSGAGAGGSCAGADRYHVRLIDFGSAVDPYSAVMLFGAAGPGVGELTLEYAPPEVLFGGGPVGSAGGPAPAPIHGRAGDMWALGVVWLELLLGSPHVFQLPPHTRALLDAQLDAARRPPGDRELLHLLRGMMEWCVYPPDARSRQRGGHEDGRKQLLTWSCSDDAVAALIRARDPLGVGAGGLQAVRLLRRLLSWDPLARPTAREALMHAYFQDARGDTVQCAVFGQPGWC